MIELGKQQTGDDDVDPTNGAKAVGRNRMRRKAVDQVEGL